MEARDILTEYPELEHLSVPRVEREYPEKFASILALLESTPSTAVELSEELSMPIPQMIALMSELEMLGGIIEIGGGKYERSV